MYADVVVLTYQSPEIGTYTYEIPENLASNIKIGQLVEVPFGTRTPLGLIVDIKSQKTKGIETRPIIRSLFNFPILLPYQIKLLKWMSKYYYAPLVNCLEAMLPEIPRSMLNAQRLTTNAKIDLSVQRSAFSVQQTLILIPNLNRLPETLAKFPQAKNHIIYHNQLKMSERFEAWLKILQGSVDYIFGLRSAIFTPCPNLAKIIIFDEHDQVYKDIRSPSFDTLTVAEKLESLTGAKLKIIDSSPKITTYFTHQTQLKFDTIGKYQPKVKIVSMLEERETGNKSPISQPLETNLKKI